MILLPSRDGDCPLLILPPDHGLDLPDILANRTDLSLAIRSSNVLEVGEGDGVWELGELREEMLNKK